MEGVQGDAMTPYLPCAMCGIIDDLETVNPIGIIDGRFIAWKCSCGFIRIVGITNDLPKELAKKAMNLSGIRW